MNVYTPSVPKHLRVTPTMVDDFLCDPVLGCRVFFGIHFDAFQAAAARIEWWVPNVIDESGFGTGKSLRLWALTNLRALLIEEQWCCAYYQTFAAGQSIFWPYYNAKFAANPLFRAQLGQVDQEGDPRGKDNTRGPACFTQHFKNGSRVMMPAPNWLQDARSQAGLTLNWVVIDEWTKVETMSRKPAPGRSVEGYLEGGINQQILGRLRGPSFNQHHMLWGNHCIFSATAESTQHPSQVRVAQFQREIAAGNPNYAIITFNFKDASNRRSHTGKPFKEEIINWATIRNMKTQLTRSRYLREVLGVRIADARGLYSEEALDRCVESGRAFGTEPEIGRSLPDAYYFMGIDPAPAQRKTADEGAMVILRVRPRPGLGAQPGNTPSDWLAEFVWAFRVTPKMPFTIRQWAGFIHQKHRQFGLNGICLDPQGGGQWIYAELNKHRQLIDGVEMEVTPIATLDDQTVAEAHFILTLFRGTDPGISQVWPLAQGVDGLYDAAHTAFIAAIEHTEVAFPVAHNDRDPASMEGWSDEKRWALKNLDAVRDQLSKITAATREDGMYALTRHGARQFGSIAKKDLAYAAMYAYTRFLVWLRLGGGGEVGDPNDPGFYGDVARPDMMQLA